MHSCKGIASPIRLPTTPHHGIYKLLGDSEFSPDARVAENRHDQEGGGPHLQGHGMGFMETAVTPFRLVNLSAVTLPRPSNTGPPALLGVCERLGSPAGPSSRAAGSARPHPKGPWPACFAYSNRRWALMYLVILPPCCIHAFHVIARVAGIWCAPWSLACPIRHHMFIYSSGSGSGHCRGEEA